ncbi:uncharacterized protein LOC124649189 [Lolium rigidum]|uniref:uncharacterized protein LOC124649189 n=1 Tax=Lolium rigidum TaxID=89674 RepID=UPI001F5D0E2D|nr:uncharacterized protein LOC124649189 [Lolium rigidum]
MAALLRQGARRIGGAVLQRTQVAVTSPAVAEERRRLVPRRMYSTEEQITEELTRKIQQKKEELYDLMLKAEQSIWTSSFRNKRLLQLLSVQVKPRPGDTKWQLMCLSKRAINAFEIAGLVALSSLITYAGLTIKRLIGERKIIRAMIVAEMREAEAGSRLIENQP